MRSILSIGGTSGAQKTPFGIIKKSKLQLEDRYNNDWNKKNDI